MDVAGQLKEITAALGIPFIFKSSYDKANRSSGSTFRGPGMEQGPGDPGQGAGASSACRCSPTCTPKPRSPPSPQWSTCCRRPAFLCRQTDFIRAVAQRGKPVNIKKGQFLAPRDMKNVIDKARAAAQRAA